MGGLTAFERRVILVVIASEIVINVINGIVSMIDPLLSLAPMSDAAVPAIGGEVARWFGAVTLAFGGWLLFRSLSSPPATRLVLEALLVGDVLYTAALMPFTLNYGKLPMIVAPYALTAVMFAARLYWLLKEDWPTAKPIVLFPFCGSKGGSLSTSTADAASSPPLLSAAATGPGEDDSGSNGAPYAPLQKAGGKPKRGMSPS